MIVITVVVVTGVGLAPDRVVQVLRNGRSWTSVFTSFITGVFFVPSLSVIVAVRVLTALLLLIGCSARVLEW